MPSLETCKNLIKEISEVKGWGNDPSTKIFYAMIELGEAGDVWKHRGDEGYLEGIGIHNEQEFNDFICEELIDTLFYVLDCFSCIDSKINPDDCFNKKLSKNWKRDRVYLDDTR